MRAVIVDREDELFEVVAPPPTKFEHPVHGVLRYEGFAEGKAFYKIANPLEALALPPKSYVLPDVPEDKLFSLRVEAQLAYHTRMVEALTMIKQQLVKEKRG